jgi:hypothetical protein
MNMKVELPKIFADFQNSDKLGRVRLNTVGTIHDLNRLGLVLHEGDELTLSSFELEVAGKVTYSAEECIWVATIDWNNIKELPGNRIP